MVTAVFCYVQRHIYSLLKSHVPHLPIASMLLSSRGNLCPMNCGTDSGWDIALLQACGSKLNIQHVWHYQCIPHLIAIALLGIYTQVF